MWGKKVEFGSKIGLLQRALQFLKIIWWWSWKPIEWKGSLFVWKPGVVFVRNNFEGGYDFCSAGGVGPARMYLQQRGTTSPPKLQRGLKCGVWPVGVIFRRDLQLYHIYICHISHMSYIKYHISIIICHMTSHAEALVFDCHFISRRVLIGITMQPWVICSLPMAQMFLG